MRTFQTVEVFIIYLMYKPTTLVLALLGTFSQWPIPTKLNSSSL